MRNIPNKIEQMHGPCVGSPRDRMGTHTQRDDGFTLVEMLVVLAIIGLIATLATPQVLRYLASAKASTTATQIRGLQGALELYYLDNGAYPDTNYGLDALIDAPESSATWNGPYLRGAKSIEDAWGNDFTYKVIDNGRAVSIISLGADGNEGGEGPDADIGG